MAPLDRERHDRSLEAGHQLAHAVVVYLVSLLLGLPLFVILHPFIPEMVIPLGDGWRVDHLVTFVLILLAFVVLVRRFLLTVYAVLVMGMLALTVTTLLGTYSMGDLYRGYADLLRSLRVTAAQVPLAAARRDPFPDAGELRAMVNGVDPRVRKSAVAMATAHFTELPIGSDEFTLVQSFSIFKEINGRWRYVSDVKGGEYFAPPSESLELMAGDCDDHAVLMAASIKAIGGEVRLVRTEGHVYPEMKVGDDDRLERAAYLIRKVLFRKEVGETPLYHHTDAGGIHWINLDYTRNYPGGELMNERIVGILEL